MTYAADMIITPSERPNGPMRRLMGEQLGPIPPADLNVPVRYVDVTTETDDNIPGMPNGELWDATMRNTTRQSLRLGVAGDRGGPMLSPRPWATGETQRRATFTTSYALPSFRALGRVLVGLSKLPLLPDQPFSPVQNQRVLRPAVRADRPAPGPWDRNVSVT